MNDEMHFADELNNLDVLNNNMAFLSGEMDMELQDLNELETYVMDLKDIN